MIVLVKRVQNNLTEKGGVFRFIVFQNTRVFVCIERRFSSAIQGNSSFFWYPYKKDGGTFKWVALEEPQVRKTVKDTYFERNKVMTVLHY